MFNLPENKSQKWVNYLAIFLTINLIALLISRLIVGQNLTLQTLMAFGIISGIVTLFLIPGYLGARTYTFSVIVGDTAGMLYLFYQVLTRKNDGWVDLTSIFSYLTLVVIGIVTGIVAEIIVHLIHRKK